MLELQIKREIKRLVRIDPNISFGALRSEAIQLEEDGLSGPHRSVHVREVHEPRYASDDPSPLERIAAQLELLATTQSEIVFFASTPTDGCGVAAGWLRGGCGVAAGWLRGGCGVAAGWLRGGCGVAAGWLRGACGVAAGWLRDLADRNPVAAEHIIVSIAGEGVTPRIRVEAGKRYTLYR